MKLISPNKAADTLGVSVKTVYRMINRGKLTRIKGEASTRILEDEVFAYLQKNGMKEATL